MCDSEGLDLCESAVNIFQLFEITRCPTIFVVSEFAVEMQGKYYEDDTSRGDNSCADNCCVSTLEKREHK